MQGKDSNFQRIFNNLLGVTHLGLQGKYSCDQTSYLHNMVFHTQICIVDTV